jgi:hypothetical protein
VAHARRLIDAHQYVLDSDWGEAQPKAADENDFLESHSWEEYAEWYLGLTEGASQDTKASLPTISCSSSTGSEPKPADKVRLITRNERNDPLLLAPPPPRRRIVPLGTSRTGNPPPHGESVCSSVMDIGRRSMGAGGRRPPDQGLDFIFPPRGRSRHVDTRTGRGRRPRSRSPTLGR